MVSDDGPVEAAASVHSEHVVVAKSQASHRPAPSEHSVAVPVHAYKVPVAKQQVIQNNSDINPQDPFLSNCMFGQTTLNDIVYLHWSTVGTISLRKQLQYTSVDVHFADVNFHRNLQFNDDFKICMASMNYNGLLAASKAQAQDLDAYEEDDEVKSTVEKDVKYSNLYFKPFNDSIEWHYKMPEGESIDCIAQGSGWVACCTDANYLRVFSTTGV